MVSTSTLLAQICFAEQVGIDHEEPMRVCKILAVPPDEPCWEDWDLKLSIAGSEYAWKGQYMVADETLLRWGLHQLSVYTFCYLGRTYRQGRRYRQLEEHYRKR